MSAWDYCATPEERAAVARMKAKFKEAQARWEKTQLPELSQASPDIPRAELKSLEIFLNVAVPLWVDKMRDWDRTLICGKARELADVVACEGDWYAHNTKKGRSSRVFNSLAQGLACAVMIQGEVEFLGMKFLPD